MYACNVCEGKEGRHSWQQASQVVSAMEVLVLLKFQCGTLVVKMWHSLTTVDIISINNRCIYNWSPVSL